MAKRIVIKISPSGEVRAETLGVKGPGCAHYIAVLEELLRAQVVDSEYTPEFHETANLAGQVATQHMYKGDAP